MRVLNDAYAFFFIFSLLRHKLLVFQAIHMSTNNICFRKK